MTRADTHMPEERETQPAPDFKTELLGLVPFLRAFARSLTEGKVLTPGGTGCPGCASGVW